MSGIKLSDHYFVLIIIYETTLKSNTEGQHNIMFCCLGIKYCALDIWLGHTALGSSNIEGLHRGVVHSAILVGKVEVGSLI